MTYDQCKGYIVHLHGVPMEPFNGNNNMNHVSMSAGWHHKSTFPTYSFIQNNQGSILQMYMPMQHDISNSHEPERLSGAKCVSNIISWGLHYLCHIITLL